MINTLESGMFFPMNGFQDDVHGEILLSPFEQTCVDTPEFQRLFRITQLGFIDFVFQTANHTRGVHSIGVCHMAQKLLDALRVNEAGVKTEAPPITKSEVVLIRAGALLHDISHGPFSHDIERKHHKLKNEIVTSAYGKYPKHDEWKENPVLFLILFDRKNSILARVLTAFSTSFYDLLLKDAADHAHIHAFTELANGKSVPKKLLLPQLLFHLLAFENEQDAQSGVIRLRDSFANTQIKDWHLGWQQEHGVSREVGIKLHKAWYQPYRHDIIGNTLSADLLDYLLRDIAHMNLGRGLDLQLLKDYCRVPSKIEGTHRCAVNLWDKKRGIHKPEVLNDLFRLLDLRHEIHAKAVFHRMALAATAMLSRALITQRNIGTNLRDLFWSKKVSSALISDDYFLAQLSHQMSTDDSDNLVARIAERRFYRPIGLISGAQVKLPSFSQDKIHELAGIIDSTYYSSFLLFICWCVERYLRYAWPDIAALNEYLSALLKDELRFANVRQRTGKQLIIWTTPYKQLHKSPDILVSSHQVVSSIQELANQVAEGGHTVPLAELAKSNLNTAEAKYADLWKIYVFMEDSLFSDNSVMKAISGAVGKYEDRLEEARMLLCRALHAVWGHWVSKPSHDESTSLNASCPDKQLASLISSFEDVNINDAISTLKLEDYLHDISSAPAESKCRDIRHRFPYEEDEQSQPELEFTEVLKRVQFIPQTSDRESLKELLPRYQTFIRKKPKFMEVLANNAAANRGEANPAQLHELLRFDLP